MRDIVKIGDVAVDMLANAATPYLFRRVFHLDILRFFAKSASDDMDDATATEMITRLGYVMARQADGVIDAAGEDDMIDWLAQFAPNDISDALADVMALYNRQSVTTSTSKKKAGGQTER